MFPVEIWEEILKHGSAKDLIRLRRVSRTWDAMIAQILELRADVWYRQCVEDIPEKLWSSMLEHQNDPDIECQDFHKARNNLQLWLKMYRSWREWQRAVRKIPQIGTFEPLPQHRPLERITCVAALSNIIAIGSTEGYIAFYDMASDKIFYRADHAEFLQNVQLLRNGEIVIAVSSSINHRTKFWNLTKKTEEKSRRCTGLLITTSFDHCYMIRNNRLAGYRLSERISENGQSRKVLQMLVWMDRNMDLVRKFAAQGDEFVAAVADGNQVTLCTEKNRHLQVTCENEETMRAVCININQPEINEIRYYRIFKPRVTVCIGVYGEVGFSIDGGHWKVYNLFRKFGAPVTTIVFHVAVLVLGLQSGEVHLFQVKDAESLGNLDFDVIESKRLMLDTEAIISLNVTEYDSAQYLVAASNRHVHLVKFT